MIRSSRFGTFSAVAAGLALALMVVGMLNLIADHQRSALLAKADTLLIGSSLVYYASPDASGGPILSDQGNRQFLRIGPNMASEWQLLRIARQAMHPGLRDIVIEANPIISRFANQSKTCDLLRQWFATKRKLGSEIRRPFRGGTRDLVTYPDGKVSPETLDRFYPLKIVRPCFEEDWAALVANHPDTRFTFVVMPRSKIARDTIGADTMAAFTLAAEELAYRTNGSLLVVDPGHSWEDIYFADQAHLSRAGSTLFQSVLALWLETEQ